MKKLACLMVVALAAVWVSAEDDKEILVTAGRGVRSSDEVAANVTVIGREEISASRKDSIVDVLDYVEGVVVQGVTGNPAMSQVSMRGFGENSHGRVLVMVDGRRLNWPNLTNIDWLQVPLSRVERIEVVRGSGSVLYGDHAVGGVINIITSKAVPEKPFEIKATAGSDGLIAAALAHSSRYGATDVHVNIDHYEEDGYRDSSAFESTSYGLTVGSDLNDSTRTTVSALVQTDEYELPGSLSKEEAESDPKKSSTPDNGGANDYFNVHGTVSAEPADGQSLELGLSVSRQDTASDMASFSSFSDRVLDSIAVMPKYVIGAEQGKTGNRLTVGVDVYRDELQVDRFSDKARTMPGNSAEISKDTVGGYVYDEYRFDNDLIVAAGIRVEENEVSAEVGAGGVITLDESKDHDAAPYELSILKKLGDGSKVFARYSTSYRYPFLDEQIAYSGFSQDRFYQDIEPEEGWTVEAGIDKQIADGLAGGVTVYLMEMDDEIAYNAVTMRNENLDKTKRTGVECNLSYVPVEGLKVAANYSFVQAEFAAGANDGKDIPLVPQHKATVTVEGELPAGLTARTVLSHTGERWLGGDNANSGDKLDAYTTVDLYLTHKSSVEGLEIYAGVENLFDEQYSGIAYKGFFSDGYYPAAGTTFKGGAVYRF